MAIFIQGPISFTFIIFYSEMLHLNLLIGAITSKHGHTHLVQDMNMSTIVTFHYKSV